MIEDEDEEDKEIMEVLGAEEVETELYYEVDSEVTKKREKPKYEMRFLEILTDWLRLKLGRVTPMASFMVITFNLVTSEKDLRLI